MCGIAGEISWDGRLEQNSDTYERMKDSLRRRGPDQDGEYIEEHAALVHTRLCVIDIENGRQPMQFSGVYEDYALVYNGELYNTAEIRSMLRAKGYSFDGHSDTEVLIKAYAEWKDQCVNYLNGIFAFAVWEKKKKRLFIARDRMGVKPFFYVQEGGRFLFASEIKALLRHPLVRPEVSREGIAEIMLIGPGRTPGYGVFCQVKELPRACCGYFSQDGLHIKKYWELQDREHTDTFEQTAEYVRFLVTDAIERQLVSDVPVCTFLSGGLDSSLISSVADRYFTRRGKQLHTFSVSYKENERYFHASKFQPNSDDAFIRRMNEYLGAVHHQVVLDTPELVQALFSAVDARDLPGMADVDSSLLLFCGEIKKYGTVALSGECADEIFGGYPWYRDPEVRMAYGFPWAQSTAYRSSFLREEIAAEIDAPGYVDRKYRQTVEEASKCRGLSATESRMREMMQLNLDWFMQTLLDRKDRMSMYQGLEVRVPFCDYRIAEYLYSVPWEMKDYRNTEKGLLREAMKGYLPQEVLWRKKSPYPKTHHPDYLKTVSALLREVINTPGSPLLQMVRKDSLEALLSADDPQPWYGQLMTTPQTIAYFLQVDYWMRRYRVTLM